MNPEKNPDMQTYTVTLVLAVTQNPQKWLAQALHENLFFDVGERLLDVSVRHGAHYPLVPDDAANDWRNSL